MKSGNRKWKLENRNSEIENPKRWGKPIRSIDPTFEQTFAEVMVQIEPIVDSNFHGCENRKKITYDCQLRYFF
jgi:hypothetical protein